MRFNKELIKRAHQMARGIKNEYKDVDYRTQFGLCLSYFLNKEGEYYMRINETEPKKTYILNQDIIIKDAGNIVIKLKKGTPFKRNNDREVTFICTIGAKILENLDKSIDSISERAKAFYNRVLNEDFINTKERTYKFNLLKVYLHSLLNNDVEVEELTLNNADQLHVNNDFKIVYAIEGNTYSIKEQIKKDGGKWNANNRFWYFTNADLKGKYDLVIKFLEE